MTNIKKYPNVQNKHYPETQSILGLNSFVQHIDPSRKQMYGSSFNQPQKENLSPQELKEKYGEDGEHPLYPRSMWQAHIAWDCKLLDKTEETLRKENLVSNYWDWVVTYKFPME